LDGDNDSRKAAIAGWRDILQPGVARGAKLWPFDGSLTALGGQPGVTLAESYPALAYAALGAPMSATESKRRQADRKSKAEPVLTWASKSRVHLADCLAGAVIDGFGHKPDGEDPFDAVIGLFAMIEIADGRRPERAATRQAEEVGISAWEGWILGR
jgi:hypothetical protein